MLDVLRHMVPLDDAITKSSKIKTRGRMHPGNQGGNLNLPQISGRGDDDDQSMSSRMIR